MSPDHLDFFRKTHPDSFRKVAVSHTVFDQAGGDQATNLISQMWAHGTCHRDEVLALFDICPHAFWEHSPKAVIGQKAVDILPKLTRTLMNMEELMYG